MNFSSFSNFIIS